MSILIVLQIVALVLMWLAAFNTPAPARLSYGWAGLALWFTLAVVKL